ncbi:hypothetical protein KVT40_003868 [Elsinoe batatas]|uniref:Putative gamma-glutamylcyclotransferase n=1 Tax=Elsinoe batatas TaxID=2601811 RepID=A0A8K0L303_9PEZI|nr:hypothetical protein KVT40_003868 [Elsinoe batatas]
MGDNTLFFYGTLTFPPILHRVIHGPSNPTFPTPSSSYVRTYPALLPSHRRHRVRGADYPAVIPSNPSASVRGTLAVGLTDADVRRLDIFEGEEYDRRKVGVRRLLPKQGAGEGGGEVNGGDSGRTGKGKGAEGEGAEVAIDTEEMEEGEEVEAETYIWIAGEHRLEDEEWDFETFKREKMRFWIGRDGTEGETGREEFEAVDRQDGTGGRGVDGDIGRQLEEYQRGVAGVVGGAV